MSSNGDATPRDPESTRERILDAALNIFSYKGYHDTRLDEIVDESHTSKGSIYFHFANKERLFLALVDRFANLLERRVTEAIAHEEKGIERVRVALDWLVEVGFPRDIVMAHGLGAETAVRPDDDRGAGQEPR